MNEKSLFYKIYINAHNNAVELLSEANILFEYKKYPRAYFLAYTGLEEIAKSQLAADVYTGFIKEDDFYKSYREHKDKIGMTKWAQEEANYRPMWVGPDIEDIIKLSPDDPDWNKRQNSLYVNINNNKVLMPRDEISQQDTIDIIHILSTSIDLIKEIEYQGERIGTKGFMK